MNRPQDESPEEHYHSSGLALVAIGGVIMIMALVMMCLEHRESEYDHVSNLLVGLMILITGLWLRSHDAEDMES